MPIHCERLRLSYFPIPKVGTSTMRAVLRAINANEEERKIRTRGKGVPVTRSTAAREFSRAKRENAQAGHNFETLLLVRDPERRFYSAFHNKIRNGLLARKVGSDYMPDSGLPVRDPERRFYSGVQNMIRNGLLARKVDADSMPGSGLPTRPDLEFFLDHFEKYSDGSDMIRSHFRSQRYFIGRNPGYFDHIYQLEKFDEFAKFIQARLGKSIAFPHQKKQDLSWVADLPSETRQRVRNFYREDYALLSDYYQPVT